MLILSNSRETENGTFIGRQGSVTALTSMDLSGGQNLSNRNVCNILIEIRTNIHCSSAQASKIHFSVTKFMTGPEAVMPTTKDSTGPSEDGGRIHRG